MAETSQYTVSIKVVGEESLRKLQAQLSKVATQTKVLGNQQTALKATGGAFKSMGSQVQNASYQLTDFIVQVQGGTSASRAFSQQAPQLLGAFGALGAALGIIAAIAPAVWQAFAGTSRTVKEAATSVQEFVDATDNVNTNIDDLTKKYGELAVEMRPILEIQREIAQIKALDDMKASIEGLSLTVGFLEGNFSKFVGNSTNLLQFASVVGLTAEEADALQVSLDKLKGADGFTDQRKAAEALIRMLEEVAPLSQESTKSLKALYDNLANIVIAASEGEQALKNAADAQRDLTQATIAQLSTNVSLATQVGILEQQATALENGAKAADAAADATRKLAIAQATAKALEGDNKIDAAERAALDEYIVLMDRQADALARIKKATDEQSKALSGSARSTAEAKRELNAFLGQLDKFRTPAEKAVAAFENMKEYGEQFADVLAKSPELMALYNKGLEELSIAADENKAAMKAAADSIKSSFGSALEDGIINAAKGGKDAFTDMAESILNDIARMIIQMRVVKPLMDSLFPKGGGGPLSWLTGNANGNYFPNGITGRPLTAFATGGIIGGRTRIGSNLIGENGPEAVMPLRRSNGRMGVAAAPVNVNVINNAGAEVKVSETTGNDGSRTIDVMIESKMRNSFATGAMDKVMKSRFGTSPVGG